MINATVKISSQGQITIPKNVRELTGMIGGSEVVVVANTEKPLGISIYPKPVSWIDTVACTGKGIWGHDSTKYIRDLRNEWETKNPGSNL